MKHESFEPSGSFFMLNENTMLGQGDCLELMKHIPDGSVDLILTDPPYGTTACKWDSVIPFESMWVELKRIIKSNGVIVLFASQPFTTKLIHSNMEMFRYLWVWEKEQGVNFLSANKQPMKVHEDIIIFYTDLGGQRGAASEYNPIRDYLKNERKLAGLTAKKAKNILGNTMGGHYFTNGVQFCIPTEENYKKLQSTGFFSLSYSELKRWCDELELNIKTPTYNPQMTIGVPYVSGGGNSGEVTSGVQKIQTKNTGTRYPRSIQKFKRETGLHPTQKPVALLEYLIKTYTQESETVLDFTMGSGSTGVACVNTGRKFIGIEMDDNYFNIAKKRIQES